MEAINEHIYKRTRQAVSDSSWGFVVPVSLCFVKPNQSTQVNCPAFPQTSIPNKKLGIHQVSNVQLHSARMTLQIIEHCTTAASLILPHCAGSVTTYSRLQYLPTKTGICSSCNVSSFNQVWYSFLDALVQIQTKHFSGCF